MENTINKLAEIQEKVNYLIYEKQFIKKSPNFEFQVDKLNEEFEKIAGENPDVNLDLVIKRCGELEELRKDLEYQKWSKDEEVAFENAFNNYEKI